MKSVILSLALAFASLTSLHAAESVPAAGGEVLEKAVFFEPTQAEIDKSHEDIKAQQTRYETSKKAKDYSEARRLAVFHVAKAWAWHNEALDIITSKAGWCDAAKLQHALTLWQQAEAEIGDAIAKKSRVASAKQCAVKVADNSAITRKQIKALEKKPCK